MASKIRENLAGVRERIRNAALKAARDPDGIRLIVVAKEAAPWEVQEALAEGVIDIGENRVKDAVLKRKILNRDALRWHMIGHLQSNKAKEAVSIFSLIHSVDNTKLARLVDKEAEKQKKCQEILIQVNASGEKTKFGIRPEDIDKFIGEIRFLNNINLAGLMTIAPLVDNAEKTRHYFRSLKALARRFNLMELSMGMTQDFEIAIEEGATMVRIGRAVFKG